MFETLASINRFNTVTRRVSQGYIPEKDDNVQCHRIPLSNSLGKSIAKFDMFKRRDTFKKNGDDNWKRIGLQICTDSINADLIAL